MDDTLSKLSVGQIWRPAEDAYRTTRTIVHIVDVSGATVIAFRRRNASSLEYARLERFLTWARRAEARVVEIDVGEAVATEH